LNELSEWEGLFRLGLAALLGGAIGFERETLNKAAGLRTHMLVALGAALFMVSSILLIFEFNPEGQPGRGDVTRIGSTIVTGIGFLAGGIIFTSGRRPRGITTAAGLWVATAVGMAVGAGFYITAAGATALALVILTLVQKLQVALDMKPESAEDRSIGDYEDEDDG
jgi:putative Mg2+ transporter-C (MgtC) family protein